MLATEIIARKRDQSVLSLKEIRFMIEGMLDESVPEYQVSAWAMAILIRGMTAQEIADLTQCMLESGSSLKAGESSNLRVDKHSTGGLGDKVSLVLAPLLACEGLDVPMLSGRGLGITGGTLDKLEAIEGFRCDLNENEIAQQVDNIGCVITGTTPNIAPADKKLYALRDVTATVPSAALITSSILSKKLAESLDALVLDVKFGSGCFMKTRAEAKSLATTLRDTGACLGLKTSVVLSDMNQPLGRMVGNACEVNEAIQVLQNLAPDNNLVPDDVIELTLRLGAEILQSTNKCSTIANGMGRLLKHLSDGTAHRRFVQMIEQQGGKYQDKLELEATHPVLSEKNGWIAAIDGERLGRAVIEMGGGRRLLGDELNHRVGLEMLVEIGEPVELGQPMLNLFCSDLSLRDRVAKQLQSAISVSNTQVAAIRLIDDFE
ncbi:MAG: thymidine phosphorylase [Planctomycetota bacterium]